MKKENKKAVVYIRYQEEQQRNQQMGDCLKFAKQQGLDVVGGYIDYKQSGMTLDRPKLQEMLRDASNGKFQVVIVDWYYKICRDHIETVKFRCELAQYGVELVSVHEQEEIGSKQSKLWQKILDDVDKEYRRRLSERIKRGIQYAKEKKGVKAK